MHKEPVKESSVGSVVFPFPPATSHFLRVQKLKTLARRTHGHAGSMLESTGQQLRARDHAFSSRATLPNATTTFKEVFLLSDFTIRVARPQDARQIAAIYAPYVEQTAISFETVPPTATAMLRRMDDVLHRYPYLIAERDGRVLGFAYAHPFVGRAAYDWSAEMTIYLAMDERHHGLGGALYRKLEDILRAQGVLNLNACIGCPKEDKGDEYLTYNSVDFHKHLGYKWVGLFHDSGYKFGRWYDMCWMEKILGEHKTPAAPIKTFPEVRKDFGL
jgi:phosphinothricin acetyltransferase